MPSKPLDNMQNCDSNQKIRCPRITQPLWDAYRKYFGKDDPSTLVWQAPTRTMNPSVPQEFIDEEYERDPISANAEYGANFRSDVDAFVRADVVEDAVISGRYELAPVPLSYKYHGFCDPTAMGDVLWGARYNLKAWEVIVLEIAKLQQLIPF